VTDWAQRKTSIIYDLAGHVTSITRPNGSYRTMNYDAAGQLTNIWEQMANTLPIAWFRFNWNSNATVNWEFLAPPPHSVTVPTRTMTYDSDNRLYQFQGPSMGSLQSVSVDSDGNLTSGPLTNDTFAAYTYDARNRLSNAGGVTNTYDPAGNRVGVTIGTNTTRFIVNPNANLPQVLMRIKNGVTNYYVYGPGLLYQVTETATGTNTLTYHFDYRGSTIALSGNNGVVTDRIEYSLYGLITYRAGTSDTPFLFNGKYGVMTDPNSLLYMRARYYNPYLCRFISADPSGFNGGMNFYAYANANPVSYLDPFGLGAVSDNLLVSSSWFNAPTPEEQQMQQVLAGFVNLVTLGGANLISSATSGTDLTGNNLNVADAFEQTLQAGAFVASLPLAALTDGGSLEAEGTLEAGLDATADEPMITALGSRRGVANFVADNPGLNINTFQWENIAAEEGVPMEYVLDRENALWLNAAIQRGDTIYEVTDPAAHAAALNRLPIPPPSAYLNLERPMLRQYEGVNIVHYYTQ
jgi:RHS repeat-associated protein